MRPDDRKEHLINPEDLKTTGEAEIFFRPSMFIENADDSDAEESKKE